MGPEEIGHEPPPYYRIRALSVCRVSLQCAALTRL